MTILDLNGSNPALPTSGTYEFTVTRDDIITLSMRVVGRLGEAENPTPGEMQVGAQFLNMLVKQWMGRQDFAPGLKMWTRQRGDLFLATEQHSYELGPTGDHWAVSFEQTTTTAAAIAGATSITVADTTNLHIADFIGIVDATGDLFWTTVDTFTLTTVNLVDALTSGVAGNAVVFSYTTKQQRPLELLTLILRDINRCDTPINKMTLETYEVLPSKTQLTFQSDPCAAYYESQLNNGVLYLDVGGAQDVTKHIHIVFLRAIQDFDNPLDAPEYPQQWYLALVMGLAKLLAPIHNAPWTKEMQENHDTSIAIARESPSETTELYFQCYAEENVYG
jgi:hypothetical protein